MAVINERALGVGPMMDEVVLNGVGVVGYGWGVSL